HFFEKEFPAFAPNVGKSALRREVAIGCVQVIDGREGAPAAHIGKTLTDIFLRHVLPDGGDVLHHVAIAVDDFLSSGHRFTLFIIQSWSFNQPLVSRLESWV